LVDFALVELNKKKRKLHAMAPLKTFLPLWKGKGCHIKKKKRLHQARHNIAKAHPHSKI
jgi:adenine-specific DNA glycosylase